MNPLWSWFYLWIALCKSLLLRGVSSAMNTDSLVSPSDSLYVRTSEEELYRGISSTIDQITTLHLGHRRWLNLTVTVLVCWSTGSVKYSSDTRKARMTENMLIYQTYQLYNASTELPSMTHLGKKKKPSFHPMCIKVRCKRNYYPYKP